MSPSSIAAQTPTSTASWPIATCRKPGQLARAEPLLDLLLEAPDEQHLAQEVPQRLLVQGALLLDLRQSSGSVRFEHERRAAVESHWIRVAGDLGARLARGSNCATARPPIKPLQRWRPTGPYRVSPTILQFSVARDGSALGPQGITRLLSRIPLGTLTLSNSQASAQPVERESTTLVESWDTALAGLPSDWSDLYAEVEFISSDYIEPAAVLCVQMNPRRDGARAAFNFRAARQAGYGVAPGMARRCFDAATRRASAARSACFAC